MNAPAVIAADETFRVELVEGPAGWGVAILDRDGLVATRRACRDASEARAFASTVRQHLYWLSEPVFRSFYRV